jgi:hypothetical protein
MYISLGEYASIKYNGVSEFQKSSNEYKERGDEILR